MIELSIIIVFFVNFLKMFNLNYVLINYSSILPGIDNRLLASIAGYETID